MLEWAKAFWYQLSEKHLLVQHELAGPFVTVAFFERMEEVFEIVIGIGLDYWFVFDVKLFEWPGEVD